MKTKKPAKRKRVVKAKTKKKSSYGKKRSLGKKESLLTNEEITTSSLKRIQRLEEIHEKRKKQHTKHDAIAFWTFIFVIIVTNFALSLLIIFFIIVLDHPLLYIITVILGLAFGLMYERLINGMSHIFAHHHVFAKLVVVLSAVVGVIYIVAFTSLFFNFYEIENKVYSHVGISIAYFVSFLIPYFISKAIQKK